MKKELLPAAEERSLDRPELFEDRRMWRRLLSQLHPDAGGDRELFAFACSVREELWEGKPVREGTEPFLRGWREAMGRWASRNRDALKNL